MIGILFVITISVFLAIVVKQPAEMVVSIVFLSVILILFPFYCVNKLELGRNTIVILSIIIVIYSIKMNGLKTIRLYLSSGLLALLLAIIVIVLITKNNYVRLWDETRLWGATPKALFYTNELQLGEDAIVFPFMQAYPPGMPLLVYFVESFNSSFQEWEIFLVYGVFVCVLLVYPVGKLGIRRGLTGVVLALAIVLIPCLLTEHGGDYAYFYNSLFIDAVLGVLTGYGLYVSVAENTNTWWKVYQLLVVSNALILLKDSGVLFAVCVIAVSVYCYFLENKKTVRKLAVFLGVLLYSLACLLFWNILLKWKGARNPVGLKKTFTIAAVLELIKKICSVSVLSFYGKYGILRIEITLSVAMLIALYASIKLTKRFKDVSKKADACVIAACVITSLLFLAGYVKAYGEELPSYQRYMSTILAMFFTYISLRVLALVAGCKNSTWDKIPTRIPLLIVLIFLLSIRVYSWETRTNLASICPYKESQAHSKTILRKMEKESGQRMNRVYLLFPGKADENCLLAQRIYMNLIGTTVNVKNDFRNMSIVSFEEYDRLDHELIHNRAEQWKEAVVNNYDYLYVVCTDNITNEAFEWIEGETPIDMGIYRVNKENKEFELVN